MWYVDDAIGGWSKLVYFNFLESLIPTWRMLKLVRWEDISVPWCLYQWWNATTDGFIARDVRLYAKITSERLNGISVNLVRWYAVRGNFNSKYAIVINVLETVIPTWRMPILVMWEDDFPPWRTYKPVTLCDDWSHHRPLWRHRSWWCHPCDVRLYAYSNSRTTEPIFIKFGTEVFSLDVNPNSCFVIS
jgi:hypothetical protein